MTRRLTRSALAVCLLLISTQVWAQGRLSQYVATCPLLSELQRTRHSQSLAAEEQKLEKPIRQTTITTSSLSEISISLLPVQGGSERLIVIERVKEPTPDSYLRYFDLDWNELPSDLLTPAPRREDFLPKALTTSGEIRLSQLLYPLHLNMYIDEQRSELHVTPSLPLAQSDRQSEELMLLVEALPTLVYSWSGTLFTR